MGCILPPIYPERSRHPFQGSSHEPRAPTLLFVLVLRGHPRPQRLVAVAAALAVMVAGTEAASASELLARNAKGVTLKVNRKGQALITYRNADGRSRVLVWGAVNARRPTKARPQVKFKIDRSGGWVTFGYAVWRNFRNVCGPYTGPALPLKVRACTAPDGSHWALQAWQRGLPNYGVRPWNRTQRAWELRISHWTGSIPEFEIYTDWVYNGRFHHLFGRLTFHGHPVYGFKWTKWGVPLDTYGRNIYVDTYNSAYGPGWRRENSFLAHVPKGNFCYGFYKHRTQHWFPNPGQWRPRGNGEQYRATVMGPGVAPDPRWIGPGLPDYDPNNQAHVDHENQMNALGDAMHAGDRYPNRCTAH
jgi:hypothetical protein